MNVQPSSPKPPHLKGHQVHITQQLSLEVLGYKWNYLMLELPHVVFIAIECFTIFLPSVYGYWGLTEPSIKPQKQQANPLERTKFDGRLFILIFGLALIIYKCCLFLL